MTAGSADRTHRVAAACRAGDLTALEALLAPGVVLVIDAGKPVDEPEGRVSGAAEVARCVHHRLGPGRGHLTVEEVNGRAGLVLRQGADVLAVASLAIGDEGVTDVWLVLNPAKLRTWRR